MFHSCYSSLCFSSRKVRRKYGESRGWKYRATLDRSLHPRDSPYIPQTPYFYPRHRHPPCWNGPAKNSVVRFNRLRTSVGFFRSWLHKRGYGPICGLWVWRRRTNCRPCCPSLSNPSTSPWAARFEGSWCWAAQHLPRDLVRPSSGLWQLAQTKKRTQPAEDGSSYIPHAARNSKCCVKLTQFGRYPQLADYYIIVRIYLLRKMLRNFVNINVKQVVCKLRLNKS